MSIRTINYCINKSYGQPRLALFVIGSRCGIDNADSKKNTHTHTAFGSIIKVLLYSIVLKEGKGRLVGEGTEIQCEERWCDEHDVYAGVHRDLILSDVWKCEFSPPLFAATFIWVLTLTHARRTSCESHLFQLACHDCPPHTKREGVLRCQQHHYTRPEPMHNLFYHSTAMLFAGVLVFRTYRVWPPPIAPFVYDTATSGLTRSDSGSLFALRTLLPPHLQKRHDGDPHRLDALAEMATNSFSESWVYYSPYHPAASFEGPTREGCVVAQVNIVSPQFPYAVPDDSHLVDGYSTFQLQHHGARYPMPRA